MTALCFLLARPIIPRALLVLVSNEDSVRRPVSVCKSICGVWLVLMCPSAGVKGLTS